MLCPSTLLLLPLEVSIVGAFTSLCQGQLHHLHVEHPPPHAANVRPHHHSLLTEPQQARTQRERASERSVQFPSCAEGFTPQREGVRRGRWYGLTRREKGTSS